MTETVELVLMTTLYDLDREGKWLPNQTMLVLPRRGMLGMLETICEELERDNIDLVEDYKEAISYLQGIDDEVYNQVRQEIVHQLSGQARLD